MFASGKISQYATHSKAHLVKTFKMKILATHFIRVFLIAASLYAFSWGAQVKIGTVDSLLSRMVYPFIALQHYCVDCVDKACFFFKSHKDLTSLCERYSREREEIIKENIELTSLLDAYRNIDELVEFKKRYTYDNGVIAQVILKQFSPHSHFFLIDAGHNRGITTNMVAVYKNCLLGRVSEVYPSYSRIVLITDPSCKVAALCEGSYDEGMNEGCGTLDYMKTRLQLPHLSEHEGALQKRVKKGNLVLSSGQGKVFPKGFGLGSIKDFSEEHFQQVLVLSPLVNFREIPYCLVLARGAEYGAGAQNNAKKK